MVGLLRIAPTEQWPDEDRTRRTPSITILGGGNRQTDDSNPMFVVELPYEVGFSFGSSRERECEE